jgi:hypothetical protein
MGNHGRQINKGGGGAGNGIVADGAYDGGTTNDWCAADDGLTEPEVDLGWEGRRGRGGVRSERSNRR